MMNLVNKTKEILLNPTVFFKNIARETGLKDCLIYFAIVWLISMILSALIASMALGALGTAFSIATLPMQYRKASIPRSRRSRRMREGFGILKTTELAFYSSVENWISLHKN